MPIGSKFAQDTEFRKLLTRRSDVDVTTAALELARDAFPDLDFSVVYRWLDERAAELTGPLARAKSDTEAIREIGYCLAGKHGLTGHPDCYDNAESSFLHKVIEQRRGLPISLSVVYMAVAERAGWTLEGVSTPRRFLTRFEAGAGPIFVDAFAGGEVLTLDECVDRLQSVAGLTPGEVLPTLDAASPRTIILRMLNNLKALHARLGNWEAAWVTQNRLVALQPAVYAERRDLALIASKTNRAGKAVEQLESCLKICPPDESNVLEEQLREAQRRLAQWN